MVIIVRLLFCGLTICLSDDSAIIQNIWSFTRSSWSNINYWSRINLLSRINPLSHIKPYPNINTYVLCQWLIIKQHFILISIIGRNYWSNIIISWSHINAYPKAPLTPGLRMMIRDGLQVSPDYSDTLINRGDTRWSVGYSGGFELLKTSKHMAIRDDPWNLLVAYVVNS